MVRSRPSCCGGPRLGLWFHRRVCAANKDYTKAWGWDCYLWPCWLVPGGRGTIRAILSLGVRASTQSQNVICTQAACPRANVLQQLGSVLNSVTCITLGGH